jgi:serine/threonine protein phosphatase PrpC
MSSDSMTFRSAARTHPGRVRSRNEDAMLDRGEIGLWAVADGMGGHSRGDWASAQVVRHLSAIPRPESAQNLLRDVRAALNAAHDEICAMAASNGGEGVIGCTVVALMGVGRFYACLWAGDSRLYRLRGGVLEQLSRDHSRVQEMIDANLLSPGEAMAHPQANVITRAIGVGDLELDIKTDRIEPGDVLLLCTDGLDKMMSDDDIAECLTGRSADAAADDLIARALDRGGRDNVTVVVVECSAGADDDETVWTTVPGGEPR